MKEHATQLVFSINFCDLPTQRLTLNFLICFAKQDGYPHEHRKSKLKISERCGQTIVSSLITLQISKYIS